MNKQSLADGIPECYRIMKCRLEIFNSFTLKELSSIPDSLYHHVEMHPYPYQVTILGCYQY